MRGGCYSAVKAYSFRKLCHERTGRPQQQLIWCYRNVQQIKTTANPMLVTGKDFA